MSWRCPLQQCKVSFKQRNFEGNKIALKTSYDKQNLTCVRSSIYHLQMCRHVISQRTMYQCHIYISLLICIQSVAENSLSVQYITKYSKISNTFLFLFSNKMLVGIHKMLIRIRGSSNKEWDFLHRMKTWMCIYLKFTIMIVCHLSNSGI